MTLLSRLTPKHKANIRAWVAALRSGRFEQTTGNLKVERNGQISYCCLGVACEVAVEDGVFLSRTTYVHSDSIIYHKFDHNGGSLPSAVMHWLGLVDEDPVIGFADREPVSATSANDTKKWTFLQIADAIERWYLPEDVRGKADE